MIKLSLPRTTIQYMMFVKPTKLFRLNAVIVEEEATLVEEEITMVPKESLEALPVTTVRKLDILQRSVDKTLKTTGRGATIATPSDI